MALLSQLMAAIVSWVPSAVQNTRQSSTVCIQRSLQRKDTAYTTINQAQSIYVRVRVITTQPQHIELPTTAQRKQGCTGRIVICGGVPEQRFEQYGPCVSVARLTLHCSRSKELHIMILAAKLGCSTCTTYSDRSVGLKVCAPVLQTTRRLMTWESACIKPIVVHSLEFMEVSVSSFSAAWRITHHRSSTTPCIVARHCVTAWLRMRFPSMPITATSMFSLMTCSFR